MENQKQVLQLPPGDLLSLDYVSTRYDAKIQMGIQPEQILEPAFWAHHGMKLRPTDEIRARSEDGTWVAYLYVLDCSRTWARVKLLSLHPLTTADVSQSQAAEEEVKRIKGTFKITYRGPHKWSVVRTADNNVLQEGFEQKGDAEGWLDRHARSQASAPPPETAAA